MRGGVFSPSRGRETTTRRRSPASWVPCGRGIRTSGPGAARCRDHLRARGPARSRGAVRGREGRHGRLRRHPHERHPVLSVRALWGERVLRSVANLTRDDGHELFEAVRAHPVTTAVEVFPLAEAETALDRLRAGESEERPSFRLRARAERAATGCSNSSRWLLPRRTGARPSGDFAAALPHLESARMPMAAAESARETSNMSCVPSVDLWWLPLGAGGRFVRLNGRAVRGGGGSAPQAHAQRASTTPRSRSDVPERTVRHRDGVADSRMATARCAASSPKAQSAPDWAAVSCASSGTRSAAGVNGVIPDLARRRREPAAADGRPMRRASASSTSCPRCARTAGLGTGRAARRVRCGTRTRSSPGSWCAWRLDVDAICSAGRRTGSRLACRSPGGTTAGETTARGQTPAAAGGDACEQPRRRAVSPRRPSESVELRTPIGEAADAPRRRQAGGKGSESKKEASR